MALRTAAVAAAYSATGGVWQEGPGRVYDTLAEVVIGAAAVDVGGADAADVGAGTGAATRALLAAGARRVVAVDAALGMLLADRARRPPAVAGDAVALPLATASVDVVVAAFSLNHVADAAAGFREAARLARPGGAVVVASYASDDGHPVKAAVDAALRARGWRPDRWYEDIRLEAIPQLASEGACRAVAAAAGLDADVRAVRVPFPELRAEDLVAWRLGMAQHAPFVASLGADARRAVVDHAIDVLGASWPPLERSVLVTTARPR